MHRRYRNIPIELLRSFVIISELGSFTEAAEALNLTQSAISSQMRRLQQLVGGDVFTKTPLGNGLSDRGKLLESYAHRILALNDQIMALGGGTAQGPIVRLGIQNSFAEKFLTSVINNCSAVFPGGNIQFICDSAPELWRLIRSGYVDMALAVAPLGLRLPTHAAWNERLIWSSVPNLSVASGQSIPLIILSEGFIDGMAIRALEDNELPYTIVFSAADMTARRAAALAGLGFMAVPERCLADELIVANDPSLPSLPEFPVGVFHYEGFDLNRFKPLVDVFTAAVTPARSRTVRSVGGLAASDTEPSIFTGRVRRLR